MIKKIKEKGFKELDIFVPQTKKISNIPKTMIFIDKIEDEIKMALYLRSLLPELIHKKGQQILWIFFFNQKASTWKFFMEEFKDENIRILIYTDAARIGVNIWDVACAIQWKMSNHLILTTLL